MKLDVTDTGTSPALFAATVTRLDSDGQTRTVRTADGNPLVLTTSGATRVGTLYDYEMPFGVEVTYSTLETPANTATATVPETRVWLIHPGVPSISMPITAEKVGSRSRKAQRGVHYPMGRKYPVVQTDGSRKAAEYTLSVYTATVSEGANLEALLDDATPLLLNVPAAKGWGITAEYVSVGDVEEARVTRFPGEPARIWQLPLTVVDAPVGGSQAERSYVDLLEYSSYTELQSSYATYAALLAGP